MSESHLLPAFLEKRFDGLPAVLSFIQVAVFFGVSGAAIARRYERCTLGVRVINNGGGLGVLAADLSKFLLDGVPQHQPPIVCRSARNPHGRVGAADKKRQGRPTKAEEIEKRAKKMSRPEPAVSKLKPSARKLAVGERC